MPWNRSDPDQAPEVGKTTHLENGADMTLIGYEEDDDGDTFTWTLTVPQ